MVAQFIHGTQYIDELVMMRAAGKGDLYYHQDANWNVIALTDQGGSVVERYLYKPYGQMTVHQVTSYGDRDGDGDVDSTDKGTPGTTCTGTVSGACRILDLDFDGDYDAADATLFDSLPQGNAQNPGRTASSLGNPFGHQGLVFDAEIGSYQNRARQYSPVLKRFIQRDPLVVSLGGAALPHLRGTLYTNAESNPCGMLDPAGLWPWPEPDHRRCQEDCGRIRCNCESLRGLPGYFPFRVSDSVTVSICSTYTGGDYGTLNDWDGWSSTIRVECPCCNMLIVPYDPAHPNCHASITHECVHACQWSRLGRFWGWLFYSIQYLWLDYEDHPWERQAALLSGYTGAQIPIPGYEVLAWEWVEEPDDCEGH